MNSEVILHHYPQSPVAEKVRVVLGIKALDWRSVQIPRVPPKPLLMPLTGGYRRTPVMQIGADIFCDSQCIIRELERRFPEPTLYPGGASGLPWALSQWTDDSLFPSAVAVVLGSQLEALPADFAADRGRLYFGPDFDLQALANDLPHLLVQLRGQFGWMEQRLAGGRPFVLGDTPGLPDALLYYLTWFVGGRYAGGADFLNQFPNLRAWEARVRDIGHGNPTDLDAEQALRIAHDARPTRSSAVDERDPQGLRPGMQVSVAPGVDGGDPPVSGSIASVDSYTIGIRHSSTESGDVVVHFPRVGYRVIAQTAA